MACLQRYPDFLELDLALGGGVIGLGEEEEEVMGLSLTVHSMAWEG